LHAHLFDSGRAQFLNATDGEALKAAFELATLEGIIPALESAHALSVLKDFIPGPSPSGEGGQAQNYKADSSTNSSAKQTDERVKINKDSIVVICLSGRGDKDMATYMREL